jgi:hypothetical protein
MWPEMQRGSSTHTHLTKAGKALPNGFGLSFVPCREQTQGHVPARKLVLTPPLVEVQSWSQHLLFITHKWEGGFACGCIDTDWLFLKGPPELSSLTVFHLKTEKGVVCNGMHF